MRVANGFGHLTNCLKCAGIEFMLARPSSLELMDGGGPAGIRDCCGRAEMSQQYRSGAGEGFPGPAVIDPTMPAPARVYDWFLGGRSNYAADREAGARVEQAFPDIK